MMDGKGSKRSVSSVCGGCVNGCPMVIDMTDDHIDSIHGMAGNFRTSGTVCAKCIAGTQIVRDPRRILYPMRRKGERGSGSWERISWDEAIAELAGKIKESVGENGPWSVSFMRGMGAGWGFPYEMLQRLCHCIGNEPGLGASECFVPRAVAQAVSFGAVPLYCDYLSSDLVIFWGRQPTNSSAPALRRIYDAHENGTKIVAIDPLRWHVAARADRYIQIEPGTDLALALAMIYVIVNEGIWDHAFVDGYSNDPHLTRLTAHINGDNPQNLAFTPEWAEGITGVPADVIKGLAREYAHTPKAAIMPGHGLEGRVNVAQTTRAIDILRMITGHIDGEGCEMLTLPSPPRDPDFTLISRVVPDYQPKGPVELFAVPPYTPPDCHYPLLFMGQGLMPTCDVFQMMEEGRIKVGIVQSGNPINMSPQPENVRSYFSKLDYLAVIDLYMTETAQQADLFLPAASYLERDEPEWFQYDTWTSEVFLRQKVATVGESLPDTQIIIKIAQALGYAEEFPTDDISWYADQTLKPSGITFDQLKAHPEGIKFAPVIPRKYLQGGFATPDGKAQIYSDIFASMGFDPLPGWVDSAESTRSTPEIADKYPMVIFTGRSSPVFVHDQRHSNTWLRELMPEPRTYINPIKARELGIQDDDEIIISSPRGRIHAKAWVTLLVRENWAYVPGGWAESNFNQLGIEDKVDAITSQANYMTCLGNVEKA